MNNDFKILTIETLKNVRNRPVADVSPLQFANKINDLTKEIIKKSVKEYNKKIEDFLMFCLLELGYKGERKKEEVTDFMVNNDIKLTQKVSRRKYCEIITVECETRNYKREMIIE